MRYHRLRRAVPNALKVVMVEPYGPAVRSARTSPMRQGCSPAQRAAPRTCFLKVSLQEGTLHPVILTYTSCLASLPLSEG